MIQKEIIETFNLDINEIFRLCIDDNNEMITRIKDIIEYEQGLWNNNIKKDKITIKLNDIPKEIPEKIIKIVLTENETVINKIKIKIIEKTENNITLKIKVKPICNIFCKINNLLKLSTTKAFITLTQTDNLTVINAKYKIKVLSNEYTNIIENYMEKILNTLFIDNMIKYLRDIENKLV